MKTRFELLLDSGVKTVITTYPAVGNILKEYDIGCLECRVGTCALKDVVSIHNLSKSAEEELMKKIEIAIDAPEGHRSAEHECGGCHKSEKSFNYSEPIQILVHEHNLIKRLLRLIPVICKKISLSREEDKQLLYSVVYFIKHYADRFHHQKEEDVLFKLFNGPKELLEVMFEEHEQGRLYVSGILDGIDKEDKESVIEGLLSYQELLLEHIKKEDEILYPLIDRNLSKDQVGQLQQKFIIITKSFKELPKECEEFIEILENNWMV